MMFGLALVLALIFGVASVALSATGGNFILGQSNSAGNQSSLVAQVVDTTKSALLVRNSGAGAALTLKVGNQTSTPESKTTPPMKVDSQALVGNLNADELDGKSATEFLPAGGRPPTPTDSTGWTLPSSWVPSAAARTTTPSRTARS